MNSGMVGTPYEAEMYHGYNNGTGTISKGEAVQLYIAGTASSLTAPGVGAKTDATYVQASTELTADTTGLPFLLGVAANVAAPGEYVSIRAYGLVPQLNLVLQARTASTAVWASYAAVSQGQALTLGSLGRFVIGVTQNTPAQGIVALEAVPTAASTVSTSTDTRLSITTAIRAFVRMM